MNYSANDIAKMLIKRTSEDKTKIGGESLTNIGLLIMTHCEKPWIDAVPHVRGTKIDLEKMKIFFAEKLASLRREFLLERIDRISSMFEGAIVGCREIVNAMPDDVLDFIKIEPSDWDGVNMIIENEGSRISVRLLETGVTWYKKDETGVVFHEEQPWSLDVSNEIVAESSKLINTLKDKKENYHACVR